MPLSLRQITSVSEIPEVVSCYLESFASPASSFTPLVAPMTGSTTVAASDRILNISTRLWFSHSADPTSVWRKVVDTDARDKVVASLRANIFTKDPFTSEKPAPTAFWLEEGSGKGLYVEKVLEGITRMRVRRYAHVFTYFAYTLPSYRRCGAGRLMMDWLVQRADGLDIESYVEASPLGYELYSRYGFRAQKVVKLTPPMQDEAVEDDEEWQLCRKATSGMNCCVLKRPVRGDWADVEESIEPKGDLERNLWEEGERP